MFRKMARANKAISREEIDRILDQEKRGVLSVIGDDGYPYGMPLNHYYCPRENRIYFHSGKTGHKIDAMIRNDRASYCVYDRGFRRDGEWALNIRSVIAFGRLTIEKDHERAVEISRLLSYRFTSDEEYISREIARSGGGVLVFYMDIEHITGKLVNES